MRLSSRITVCVLCKHVCVCVCVVRSKYLYLLTRPLSLQKVPSFTSHVQSVHTVAAAPVATVAPRKVDTLTFMSYEELAQKLAAL